MCMSSLKYQDYLLRVSLIKQHTVWRGEKRHICVCNIYDKELIAFIYKKFIWVDKTRWMQGCKYWQKILRDNSQKNTNDWWQYKKSFSFSFSFNQIPKLNNQWGSVSSVIKAWKEGLKMKGKQMELCGSLCWADTTPPSIVDPYYDANIPDD